MVLIAHAGTRYGIPFPVLARASFGILGSNVPALLRGARGLRLVRHPDLDRRPGDLHDAEGGAARSGSRRSRMALGFAVFWLWNMYIVVRGSESIKASRRGRRRS